jgi:aspartyl-tRNA(Asn)/glutamyl-tRNA(Gln) amidotransferase subunit B
MKYEAVIGLEVHAQLKTNSKIFCSCPTEFGQEANTNTCPVCLGMPGVLPVLNKRAVEHAIKTGLALNCQIASVTKFDRKNYFYADLPKGYQISQFDQPICKGGYLTINGRQIRIHRAHLEEDAGKLVHAGAVGLHGSDYSLVDCNRAGVPLLEIVSEPDIQSPEEARQYLTELRNILRYLDVCDGNLEEGSFRCDANVSLRPVGDTKLGTKTEIKNMNSFRSVQRAIQSEIERQTNMLERGERISQETRQWDDSKGTTHLMRSKEEAHDYRYFPEPDLVPLNVVSDWITTLQKQLPELPEQRRKRYMEQAGLSLDDATVLAETKELSDLVDEALKLGAPAKATANMVMGPTIGYLKDKKQEIQETKLTAKSLKDLVEAMASGTVNSTTAKQLLIEVLENGGDVQEIIQSKGLAQISDESGIKDTVAKILADNPGQLADFRSGKTKLRQFFFGEVMKATKGKANPQIINKLLDEMLS